MLDTTSTLAINESVISLTALSNPSPLQSAVDPQLNLTRSFNALISSAPLDGSGGTKTFVLSPNYSSVITNFDPSFNPTERDVLGLTGGLRYPQLSINQGTGDRSNDTIIRNPTTGEVLAVLQGVKANTVSDTSFIQLNDDLQVIPDGLSQLSGRAVLPVATFAVGPTAGQFLALNNDGTTSPVNSNGEPVPFPAPNGQPVQGFSAVLPGPKQGTYLVMVDNGFGTKANSPDSLLRFYAVEPDLTTGQVYPVDLQTGKRLDSFTTQSLFQLNDKNGKLKGVQTIVADLDVYPGSAILQSGGIPVDPAIKQGRLLTGADFDLESFRRSADGTYWFGEEFGPFLLHVGSDGTLLEAPIAVPNTLMVGSDPFVRSPDNPAFATLPEAQKVSSANLARSKGFEGMALSLDGTRLYTLLEGPVLTDVDQRRLIINVFDLKTKQFTDQTFSYRMDAPFPNRAIGDMSAINDHEFLVLERDNGQGDASNPAFTNPARSKKLYKIDIRKVDADGFVEKELVADLLNIADPNGKGGNGSSNGVFTFPFITIESVLPLDPQTVLITNDNNYPFSNGRTFGKADNNEFITLKLEKPLALPIAFNQGVSAGEMTPDSVVLWTRTENPVTRWGTSTSVVAQISTDRAFKSNVLTLNGLTDPARDYTLKLDVKGLQSGTQYYYRFEASDQTFSPTGTFKTVPDPKAVVPVRFGFSGDADGQWRPYGSLVGLDQQNLDYFIFLGDTIYETKSDRSPATADPFADPTQALADYRRKYRENLEPTNPGGFISIKELYQSQGNYILLDNHELGNKQFINGGAPAGTPAGRGFDGTDPTYDVNRTGAYINKTPGFQTLLQAYNDYQPIRETIISAPNDPRTDGTQKQYYAQPWGANSIFINVDDRSYRDIRLKTAAGADDNGPRADNPERTMLGKTQLAWLKQTLLDAQKNGTTWKIIAISSPIDETGSDSGKSWPGQYRAERNELLKFIADNRIDNVVFLSTDDHQNRVNELTYLSDPTDPNSRTRVPNTFTIVAGPIGAGGPDAITDHSLANLQKLTNDVVTKQLALGLDPLGLDPTNPRLKEVFREFNSNADKTRSPLDFYSPDTFNYVTLDISADGKTLSVNTFGINSYAANTFPEPNAANPVRRILGFTMEAATPANAILPNGVAAGDTTQTSSVLWTRSTVPGLVTFEYSTNPDFTTTEKVTATVTNSAQPVKVQVTGLQPETDYYYRAIDALGATATGRFQTAAPVGTRTGLSFGVSGDWRGELAPYPAIANAATSNLQFFLEFGDTIYADYASPAVPNDQARTLLEFRTKQSEVYSERFGLNTWADLRSATSILAVIDDHEVTNDFAGAALASSDPRFQDTTPGRLINDTKLFENGLQAFQEYNPIRDEFYPSSGEPRFDGERKLYRFNTYGSDAATFVLDLRSFRDEQLPDVTNPADPVQVGTFLQKSFDPSRTLMGSAQFTTLRQDLLKAQQDGITWKFVMVPEPIQNLGIAAAGDRFEGYAAERTALLKFINDNNIKNVVFVTADIHGTLVNNLTYQLAPGQPQIPTSTFEISTGSVAFDAPFGPTVVDLATQLNLLTPQQRAIYDVLPAAGKDQFIKQLVNAQLAPLGYDPLGLDVTLPQAAGLIDAKLLQGDYLSTQTYGWTKFDIDPKTQKLTVTTYGIPYYSVTELQANPNTVIQRSPAIVSQFEVNPR